MHLYIAAAHRTGTEDALALAEELSAWHDEMVVHTRVMARSNAPPCDDACPHARAIELWRAAREILGDSAERFTFLRAAANTAQRDSAQRDSATSSASQAPASLRNSL